MVKWTRWAVAAGMLTGAAAEAQLLPKPPQLPPFRSRAKLRCDLGPYDYFEHAAGAASAVSEPGVLWPRRAPATDPGGTRVYQLSSAEIRIDHCRIADAAAGIDPDGHWAVSFRAEQNPRIGAAVERTRAAPNRVLQTFDIRRNRFHVTVRALGPASLGVAAAPGTALGLAGTARPLGRVALAQFDLEPFWVENGAPLHKRFAGDSADLARWATQVERVELAFSYR